jgi:hypothetical protein
MPLVIASTYLSDDDFLAAFHACALPLASFRHGDHLRLAWIHLHQTSPDHALELVREGIQRYAKHHGVSHIFHETITAAWVRLLATHHEATFAQFIEANDYRLNKALLHRFWSPDALASDAAKRGWLPPDLAPLPS